MILPTTKSVNNAYRSIYSYYILYDCTFVSVAHAQRGRDDFERAKKFCVTVYKRKQAHHIKVGILRYGLKQEWAIHCTTLSYILHSIPKCTDRMCDVRVCVSLVPRPHPRARDYVCVCLSVCLSKFGVRVCESVKIRSLHETSKVDRFFQRQKSGRISRSFHCPLLGSPHNRFSSPESFANLSVVPPSNCVPRVPTPTVKKSTSWGVKFWQTWHDKRGGCKELDR